jgi:hypothetical protein
MHKQISNVGDMMPTTSREWYHSSKDRNCAIQPGLSDAKPGRRAAIDRALAWTSMVLITTLRQIIE